MIRQFLLCLRQKTIHPYTKWFDDLDMVISRSGWTGDESVVYFRSGPPMGHNENELAKNLTPYYDWGGGHVHPDSNGFLIFGNGELLIRDDDYASTKYTNQHSTLTVDNKGQLGEGGAWFSATSYHKGNGDAYVAKVESKDGFDHIIGDSTQSYPETSHVKKFRRHLLYLKPDVLIVVDDIELSEVHDMQLRFWPERTNMVKQGNGYYIPGLKANLKITPLTNDEVDISLEDSQLTTRYDTQDRTCVKLEKNGTVWRNATAITWSDAADVPKEVLCSQMGDVWNFDVAGQTISFRFDDETATLSGQTVPYGSDSIRMLLDGKNITSDSEAQIG